MDTRGVGLGRTPGGTLAGVGILQPFDTSLRLQTVEDKNASGSLQGVAYGSDTAGRLQSRYWVRTAVGVTNRVGTTHTYDAAGDLARVAYANDPSSTWGVKYIGGRLGRLQQAERHTHGVSGRNMGDADWREAFLSSLAGLGLGDAGVERERGMRPETRQIAGRFQRRFGSARGGRGRLRAPIFARHATLIDWRNSEDASWPAHPAPPRFSAMGSETTETTNEHQSQQPGSDLAVKTRSFTAPMGRRWHSSGPSPSRSLASIRGWRT